MYDLKKRLQTQNYLRKEPLTYQKAQTSTIFKQFLEAFRTHNLVYFGVLIPPTPYIGKQISHWIWENHKIEHLKRKKTERTEEFESMNKEHKT